MGFKGGVSSLYCPLLRRLPGSGWVQALGTGLSTGWSGGASLEGDDGLKDASVSESWALREGSIGWRVSEGRGLGQELSYVFPEEGRN